MNTFLILWGSRTPKIPIIEVVTLAGMYALVYELCYGFLKVSCQSRAYQLRKYYVDPAQTCARRKNDMIVRRRNSSAFLSCIHHLRYDFFIINFLVVLQLCFACFISIFVQPGNHVVDHASAVKEYSRSSADQEEPLPFELRPTPVLCMAMDYLICNLMDVLDTQPHVTSTDWFDFLWNRTRAIRKVGGFFVCDDL